MQVKNKEQFRLLFDLSCRIPWLENKEEALSELLFNDCPEGDHREMLIGLIDRFTYINRDDFSEHVNGLAGYISRDPDLNESNCVIAAMAMNSVIDSSQFIAYQIKAQLPKLGWRSPKVIDHCSKALRVRRDNENYKYVVLVDEFIGSGQTVVNRVNFIKKQFLDAEILDYTIKVRVIVGSDGGISHIRSQGIDVDAEICIKKGISDFYPPLDVDAYIKRMIELSKGLSPTFGAEVMSSLGYGDVEALYCREDGNTVNNVFPVFWWPETVSEKTRETLLHRAMG